MREARLAPTDDALLNPGMGLYLQCGGKFQPVPADAWYRSIANIAYYRPCWSDLEPEEDADLEAYFGPIFDYWVNERGERVAFRIMAESVSSREKRCWTSTMRRTAAKQTTVTRMKSRASRAGNRICPRRAARWAGK